jgi:predicted RNase H-like HicB family nuclease
MKKRKETIFKYETIFDPNGEGYTIIVPKLPGLVTEGGTFQEARMMARDAIRCYLGSILKEKTSLKTKTVKKEILAISV